MISVSVINAIRKLGEKEIAVIAGYFNGHAGSNPEGYEDLHVRHGHGVRNKEGEGILEFCAAMNITVGNTLFKKSASHLVTY